MGFFRRTKNQPSLEPPAESSSQEDGSPDAANPPAEVRDERSEKVGVFSKFRQGLSKTKELLNTDVRDLFKKEGELLDDAFLDRVSSVLIRTDMGAGPARQIREELQSKFRGRRVHMEEILETIKEQLNELIRQPETPIQVADQGPTVVMVVGVNGSGKTTSIAKLAAMFRVQGKSVVLGAGDTFRAAAVEQLKIWAERVGADIVTGQSGSDPASVAYQAVARALEQNADICILDTAGRLQTQVNLMEELSKIRRVVQKQIPDAPHEVLLVLDATAGQNAISQARGFSEAVHCTGIVLAKLDGSAKGGVVIPIRQQFDLPVKFVGVGEKAADLAVFKSEEFVAALFDGLLT
ncbi:MAG: signal recognition particle-docking protein FtsY [Planctomycetales bacterium]|nr:signal recognition particle-docking protein FtsY [Planctomycetales bacterium]